MVKTLVSRFFELKICDVVKMDWDRLSVVPEDTPIDEVLNRLKGAHHIWVVDDIDNRHLGGVITEKDFLEVLSPPNLSGYMFGMPDIRSLGLGNVETASDIMTRKVITTHKDAKIKEVIEKMISYRVRRIPVLEKKKLLGEITLNILINKYHDALNYVDITVR